MKLTGKEDTYDRTIFISKIKLNELKPSIDFEITVSFDEKKEEDLKEKLSKLKVEYTVLENNLRV